MSRPSAALLLVVFAALACDRPGFVVGEGCVLNTDCASPLVCAIGYCRRECVTSRDCGAGLLCLVSGDSSSGGCQLEHERMCTLTSECMTAGLVCQNGTCTTRCLQDRDCAFGAMCMDDGAGGRACYDDSTEPCAYNTDCMAPMVCNAEQVCQLECREDRDCPYPRRCMSSLCELPDAAVTPDAGP
jgi:hypothetical protein